MYCYYMYCYMYVHIYTDCSANVMYVCNQSPRTFMCQYNRIEMQDTYTLIDTLPSRRIADSST